MRILERDVSIVLGRVKRDGDRALEYYTKKFDRVSLSSKTFRISKERMKKAYLKVSSDFKKALMLSKKRIELFHKEEFKRLNKKWEITTDGIRMGQISSPIDSVGIYVPGGRYPYPSTLLMTAVPARIAGVSKIVVVTPPKNLKDEVLAAAYLCGVDLMFGIGGPAAIAALAFGTKTVPKVDKIVGPGNPYVTEAKRQVFGEVGIDGLAGPSEIAVWADSSSNLRLVANNLLAQAEHDPESVSYLLTGDKKIGLEILKSIPKNFLKQIKVIVQSNNGEILNEINKIAPEHLYLAVRNSKKYLNKIRNAGAIFIGERSPVALGDYAAGPSHVLPTAGSARFNSGLSVKDFFKWSSVIENRTKHGGNIFKAARTLAKAEGMHYHALSLEELK